MTEEEAEAIRPGDVVYWDDGEREEQYRLVIIKIVKRSGLWVIDSDDFSELECFAEDLFLERV